jgi:hypothetical protein
MTDHERLLVALLSTTDTAAGAVRPLELLTALTTIRTAPTPAQNAARN